MGAHLSAASLSNHLRAVTAFSVTHPADIDPRRTVPTRPLGLCRCEHRWADNPPHDAYFWVCTGRSRCGDTRGRCSLCWRTDKNIDTPWYPAAAAASIALTAGAMATPGVSCPHVVPVDVAPERARTGVEAALIVEPALVTG